MNQELIDISRWQGRLTPAQAKQLKANNILGAWVKLTQGATHVDPVGLDNARTLQDAGLAVGGYHFANLDNALDQAKNFLNNLKQIAWDLPPFIDAEAFVQTGAQAGYQAGVQTEYSIRELQTIPGLTASLVDTAIVYDESVFDAVEWIDKAGSIRKLTVYATYAAQLPRYQDIDVIGRQVTNWMDEQPKIARFKYPGIYTNPGYGNQIFPQAAASMNKYPLIIAHWGVATPGRPNIWKGKEYLSWQYKVSSADEARLLGIDGQLDRQRWGKLFMFPAPAPDPEPDPEPEPGQRSIYLVQKEEDGSTWAGTLYEVMQ